MFKEWLLKENILHDDENVQIRDASASEIPKYFVHRTESQPNINSIVQNGFNLRKFGQTARLFNYPPTIMQFDPKGIYALSVLNPNEDLQKYDNRPYVLFSASIKKALLIADKKQFVNSKQYLSQCFGGATGTQLSNALKKLGYQAVLCQDKEQIILDPSIIQVIRWSE